MQTHTIHPYWIVLYCNTIASLGVVAICCGKRQLFWMHQHGDRSNEPKSSCLSLMQTRSPSPQLIFLCIETNPTCKVITHFDMISRSNSTSWLPAIIAQQETYDFTFPLWTHQWAVLNTMTSAPRHFLAKGDSLSSLRILLPFSCLSCTKNGLQ